MKKLKSHSLNSNSQFLLIKGDLNPTNSFVEEEILVSARADFKILSLTSTLKNRPELPESMFKKSHHPHPLEHFTLSMPRARMWGNNSTYQTKVNS